jgi:hypothetical protein
MIYITAARISQAHQNSRHWPAAKDKHKFFYIHHRQAKEADFLCSGTLSYQRLFFGYITKIFFVKKWNVVTVNIQDVFKILSARKNPVFIVERCLLFAISQLKRSFHRERCLQGCKVYTSCLFVSLSTWCKKRVNNYCIKHLFYWVTARAGCAAI